MKISANKILIDWGGLIPIATLIALGICFVL